MKRLYLFIGFIFFGLAAMAQQNYFIYLQTDNKQPFYVKMDKEVYSSSSSGYAIIPKLQKGTYTLNIGFPKKEWPEQKITLNIANDAGYTLKNFKEKGWGLFNLQTLAVSMANRDATDETTITEANDFAGTLANVVNTPSLNEKKVPVKKETEAPITAVVQEEIKREEPVTAEKKSETEVVSTEVVKLENANTTPEKSVFTNTVEIISKSSDEEGIAMVYLSNSKAGKDTIQIFIADAAPKRKSEVLDYAMAEPAKTEVTAKPVIKTEPKLENNANEDKRFLNIELPNPNAKEATNIENKKEEVIEPKKVEPISKQENVSTDVKITTNNKLTFNSDCKAIATDDDFLKTRKKMAAETSAEGMIIAAKKRFKAACYSTEQIRNLSVLFLKDETRYNFFDAAYPFVHNTQNFPELVSALSDEYYISRFKAMLR